MNQIIKEAQRIYCESKANPAEATKYTEDFLAWEKEHENPLKKVVQKCLECIY
jgi:hypothetical protein